MNKQILNGQKWANAVYRKLCIIGRLSSSVFVFPSWQGPSRMSKSEKNEKDWAREKEAGSDCKLFATLLLYILRATFCTRKVVPARRAFTFFSFFFSLFLDTQHSRSRLHSRLLVAFFVCSLLSHFRSMESGLYWYRSNLDLSGHAFFKPKKR